MFAESWRSCLRNMLIACAVGIWFKLHPSSKSALSKVRAGAEDWSEATARAIY